MRRMWAWPLTALLTTTALVGCDPDDGTAPSPTPATPTNLDGTPTPVDTPTAGVETPTASPTAGNGTETPVGTPTNGGTQTPDGTPTATPATPNPTPQPTPTAEPTQEATPPKNNAPEAVLSAPDSGATYFVGQAVTFEGAVSDFESSAAELSVTLTSDLDGDLGAPAVDNDGNIKLTVFDLSEGTHVVTLTATDPGSRSGSAATTVIIEAQEGVPTLLLTSPAASRVQVGDDVTFAATVSDVQDANTDLIVAFTSSIDGEIDRRAASAEGTVEFTLNTLSRGVHTLTAEVFDTDGNSVAAGTQLVVNDAPTAPVITFNPESPRTADSLTAVAFSLDEEQDAITYTYSWTVDDADAGLAVATVPADRTSRGQRWAVTVTASDPDVSSAPVTSEVIIANTAPTATGATLSPGAANASDTLTCQGAGFSDADDDAQGYVYSWAINGEDLFGVNGATLSGRFSRGDSVVCFAAPFDGTTAGTRIASNAVSIENAAPTIDGLVLTPSSGVTEQTVLSCTVGDVRDADADALTQGYSWTLDGAPLTGATTDTLTGSSFSRGQQVGCVYTADDGQGGVTQISSNTVLVENALPVITDIAISPETPTSDDPLFCLVQTFDADVTDTVAVRFSWTIDGAPVEGQTESTLPSGTATRGQSIRCQATPNDGLADGDTATSAAVTLDNTAPSLTGASITPAEPTTGDTLTCTPEGYADGEDDAPLYAFAWTISGAPSEVTTDTLSGELFSKGDTVSCTVTPSDGFASGEPVTSAPITIANSAPAITFIQVLPAAPTTEATLTCVAETLDVDGDGVSLTYSWSVNGSSVVGATEITLEPGEFTGGDSVTCTATPSDGEDQGEPATSSPVEVGNLAPSDPEVQIVPESPLPGEALAVSINVPGVDPDGDPVSYTYTWTVDGAQTLYEGAIVPAFRTQDGQTWTVLVRATDGSALSGPASDSVEVFEPDADNDGYGALTDCDDSDELVHPGAAEPINGEDDDCDGVSDNRWPVDHPFARADVGEVTDIAVHAPGIAHMVYLDRSHNTVRYARIESANALYVDTPDLSLLTIGASELPLSIAVDADEVPHVALYDTASGDLIYATWLNQGWQTYVVDQTGDVGIKPEIAVDSFGVAHIVYYDQDNDALKYARGTLGLFDVVTVQSGLLSGVYHDIAVDEDGIAHIAWQTAFTGTLRYAAYFDGVGTPEDAATTGDVGNQVRIAVDPVSSMVHMIFVNTTNGNIEQVSGTAGSWSRETVSTTLDPVGKLALAVNPATGAPHALVYDGTTDDLFHLHKESGSWQERNAASSSQSMGYNPSIAIDSNQVLHASFFLADTEDPMYATARASGGWAFTLYNVEGVDASGNYNDIAVGTDGHPRIYSYGLSREDSAEYGLVLAQDGDGFLVRAPNSGATNHIYGQIEVDINNVSHVVEWDPSSASLTHLQSADGYTWTPTELAGDLYSSSGLSLDVNAAGGVYTAYTDYWGSRPLVCGFQTPNYTEVTLISREPAETAFTREAVVYTCSASSTTPLASPSIVSYSDQLHLAFYRQSNGDLVYMNRSAEGTWGTPVVIDAADDTGYKPSIAINPISGLPAIAHINRPSGKLRLSTSHAISWLTISVADAYAGGPVVLRYDAAGAVHLLFRDQTGKRLQYATNRTGSFVTELVALRQDAIDLGTVAGMELDVDGNPHITFHDVGTGDLAYVRGKVFPRQ